MTGYPAVIRPEGTKTSAASSVAVCQTQRAGPRVVVVNGLFNNSKLCLGYICTVMTRAFLGIRVNPELKTQLERIAQREERSMSQLCEMLLRGGVAAYQKESSKYLQRLISK